MQTAATIGVNVEERTPVIHYPLASKSPAEILKEAGNKCLQKNGGSGGPELIVAVLPEASADLYMRIKQ